MEPPARAYVYNYIMPAAPRPIVYRCRHVLLASWVFLFGLGVLWRFLPAEWFPEEGRFWVRVIVFYYHGWEDCDIAELSFRGLHAIVGFPGRWTIRFDYYAPISIACLLLILGALGLFVLSCKPKSGDRPNLIQVDVRLSILVPTALMAGLTSLAGVLVMLDWTLVGVAPTLLREFLASLSDDPAWGQPRLGWLVPIGWLGFSATWGLVLLLLRGRGGRFIRFEQFTRFLTLTSLPIALLGILGLWRFGAYRWHPKGSVYLSYSALVFTLTVLLWAFGCRVILLFLYPQYELQRRGHFCLACGYDLRGTAAAGRTECPECGAGMPQPK